jgi:HAD superfamily hydrolase (TIGR01509 family)
MKIKAVAFDMDGLMFDTEEVYRKTSEILFARRGKVYTDELFSAVMGRSAKFTYELFKETCGFPETWQELRTESEDIFLELLNDGFSAMPGLYELLEYLERRNIPKGVCTSSDLRVASEVLRRKDMPKRFDFILTAEDISRAKPDPEIYLKAVARFGISPSEMLVLEDSTAGCQAAHNAGAFPIAVRAKHNALSSFAEAKKVASSLDDPQILELL